MLSKYQKSVEVLGALTLIVFGLSLNAYYFWFPSLAM